MNLIAGHFVHLVKFLPSEKISLNSVQPFHTTHALNVQNQRIKKIGFKDQIEQ